MHALAILPSIVGIVIATGLSYYALRTIRLFKASVAARAWVYISLSGILFSLGTVAFSISDLFNDLTVIFAVGSILVVSGGAFLFLGLRKNYLFWSSKDQFM